MKIALDKQAHFWAGLAISLAIGLIFSAPWLGLLVGVAVGGLKEGYDATGRGTPDIWDFVATALGSVLGFIIFLLV